MISKTSLEMIKLEDVLKANVIAFRAFSMFHNELSSGNEDIQGLLKTILKMLIMDSDNNDQFTLASLILSVYSEYYKSVVPNIIVPDTGGVIQ